MPETAYTAITFAPIQGFIENSRKLRDLYGSSYLLSFLSWAICSAAEAQPGCSVISPALPNVRQGMPNLILVRGNVPPEVAETAFFSAWQCVIETCRQWIECKKVSPPFYWHREWGLWAKYAWEFFVATGGSIPDARTAVMEKKRSRNWTGVNWTGESSTLSGADGIAWPKLGYLSPRDYNYQQQKTEIEAFYQILSQTLGEAFIDKTPDLKRKILPENLSIKATEYGSAFVDPDEELSIPELVKRLVTHKAVAERIADKYQAQVSYGLDQEQLKALTGLATDLNPESFKDLNRLKRKYKKANQAPEPEYWTGWFMGDGDNAGNYLAHHCHTDEDYTCFSQQMRQWGLNLYAHKEVLPGDGRMVYAGGDDFLGVLYREQAEIQPHECLHWFSTFKSRIWNNPDLIRPSEAGSNAPPTPDGNSKPITVSVGFVWAAPKVPQRDVLQHCREAEKSAKGHGKDRIAFRILFNGGNHLEWVCPWWLLEGDFSGEQGPESLDTHDLPGVMSACNDPGWTHIYNDIAVLEARHAFRGHQIDVALGLVEVYFGRPYRQLLGHPCNWWNRDDKQGLRPFSGILGDPQRYMAEFSGSDTDRQGLNTHEFVLRDFNAWVINLAKVGFHLNRSDTAQLAA
ncbi:MAG: CRISPR-associated protein [Leptolyngbya sp. DLM2.Bin15]|nr:MAG: CRISPR-associated protein [Leptolyngbya sp. DLM2.Bin15]